MYKPPENSNRVKAIKSKFENNANENKVQTKPPLRKSKTLQDFKITKTDPQEKIQVNKIQKTAETKNSHQALSRQLSDPSKRNIKRTPAFRLDKTSESNNTRFIQNKTRYLQTVAKVNSHDEVTETSQLKSKEITFSELRNKFNGNPVVTPASDDCDKSVNTLKFLYSEPVPKSQRKKITNFDTHDLHNASTIKISDYYNDSKTVKPENLTNETKRGNLNKKNLENLTDTLKNALKKPLPPGPAPKKPPRTFVHTPNKHLDDQFLALNLNSDFTKKLNSELQKNISETKKPKSDPKYMLDKLETALKSKGVLIRKYIRSGNTSEDDSDNEKQKLLNLRELPTIPDTSSNAYSSCESSPKFNFNCLPSLSCGSSSYSAVKEPNSSFFVTCKNEEPVYAEPFEYQLDLEDKYSDDNNSAIESPTGEAAGRRAVRRSVHYASSPVPDVKTEEINNHVSEVKTQDQVQCNVISTSHVCSSLN